jgi:hypothetical protein
MAAAGIRPQVVVVSPLTRAIETAVGAFGDHAAADAAAAGPNGNGGGASSNGNGAGAGALLMVELSAAPGKRSAHPAVRLPAGAPPFVCMELCREHLGVHPCDRHLPLAAKMAMFPGGWSGGRWRGPAQADARE